MTVQATAGANKANGANGAPPGTGNQSLRKYFQHAVRTGLRPEKIHEGLFDFKVDQHSIISTGGEPMGRSSAIPTLAACSDDGRGLAAARKKSENGEKKKKKSAKKADTARKEWMREVEGNAIRIVYELTRHLDDSSPNELRNRVLAKFLEGDCVSSFHLFFFGFDDPSEAHGFVVPNTVGMRTDGLRGPALIRYQLDSHEPRSTSNDKKPLPIKTLHINKTHKQVAPKNFTTRLWRHIKLSIPNT